MTHLPRCIVLLLALVVALLSGTTAARAADALRKPNIIFILADDLGYGDLGSFGQQKIRTPHLDRLAAEGMRFTQHYSGNAVCAPSRCVLLTGLHPGHAFIRDNREVKPEGQFPIPASTVTLPKLLKQHGYATGAFGKWGLGGPDSDGRPLRQGFDRFYGYNCQRIAHSYYPAHLWDDETRVELDNGNIAGHGKLPPDADVNDPASYRPFTGKHYAPDLIGEQALRFIRDHKNQPFFLYYPTTVPHLALQVPGDSLDEYRGKWDETPYPGGKGYLPHQTPRAAYAAMITRMDREVGRVLDLLKELKLDEHTIVIFSSDNGPLWDGFGGTDTPFFNSAAHLRGFKGSLYEGGIRVPAIIRWPGRVAAGGVSERVTGFEDWLPTLLELAGAPSLIPANVDGISFAATLRGENQPPRPLLYREFPGYGGQQFIRVGDHVAVRQNLTPRGKKKAEPVVRTELYDLRADPSQQRDIAAEHPQIVARLEALMKQQHTPSAEFPMPALDR